MSDPQHPLNPAAADFLIKILDGVRRLDVGLGAASPEARTAMDAAPYLPSRAEMRAAVAAAEPGGLVELVEWAAAAAEPVTLAQMIGCVCARMQEYHEEQEARRPVVRPLPAPPGEHVAALDGSTAGARPASRAPAAGQD